MKKLILFVVGSLLLVGCGTPRMDRLDELSRVVLSLEKVTVDGVDRSEGILGNLEYNDSLIGLSFTTNIECLLMVIRNNTSNSIYPMWDTWSFVDAAGEALGIMHKGVKYIDAGEPMGKTVIPSRTSVDELINPVPYVRYMGFGWSRKDMLQTAYRKDRDVPYRTCRVLMAYEYQKQVYEYDFTFHMQTKRELLK